MRLTLLAAVGALAACGGMNVPEPDESQPLTSLSSAAPAPSEVPTAPSGVVLSSSPPGVTGCAAPVVTAPGAPFCYSLPDNFMDFSTRDDYPSR